VGFTQSAGQTSRHPAYQREDLGVMDGGAIAHALLDALSSEGIYIVNLPYVRPEARKQ
jgi:hypothetical protein